MMVDDPELEGGPEAHAAQLGASRLETARMKTQLFQMEGISRDQGRRQVAMETTANDPATALATAMTQAENQTLRRDEPQPVHQMRLQDIKNEISRTKRFSEGIRALRRGIGHAESARDTAQYSQGMQTLYKRTTDHGQVIREGLTQGEHAEQVGK